MQAPASPPRLKEAYGALCASHFARPNAVIESLLDDWIDEEEPVEDLGSDGVTVLLSFPCIFVVQFVDVYLGARQLLVFFQLVGIHAAEGSNDSDGRVFRCLLPGLRTLLLPSMHLDFDLPDDTPCHPRALKIGGNECVRYILARLQHHPTLEYLDLSDNPIGPALLPALRKFAKTCLCLRRLNLSGTLLSKDEVESVLTIIRSRRRPDRHGRGDISIEGLSINDACRGFVPGPAVSNAHIVTVCKGEKEPVRALCYRLPHEQGESLLTDKCMKAIQCVPVQPVAAGRALCRAAQRGHAASLLGESLLLQRIRQMIFPTVGEAAAEQERQWNAIINRMVHFTVEVNVSSREPLYEVGNRPFWVTFVPSGVAIAIELESNAMWNYSLPLGGQFVGEAAALGDGDGAERRDFRAVFTPQSDGKPVQHRVWKVPLEVFRFLFRSPLLAMVEQVRSILPTLNVAPLTPLLHLCGSLREQVFEASAEADGGGFTLCLDAQALESHVVIIASSEFTLFLPHTSATVHLSRGEVLVPELLLAECGIDVNENASPKKFRGLPIDSSGLGKDAALRAHREKKRLHAGITSSGGKPRMCLCLCVGSTSGSVLTMTAERFTSCSYLLQLLLTEDCRVVPAQRVTR